MGKILAYKRVISLKYTSMRGLFKRYISIGIINTLMHWAIFYILLLRGFNQKQANLLAFLTAVTFSFFANAKFTFKSNLTFTKYLLYVAFMGLMALTIGAAGDKAQLPSIITLIIFSSISLIVGFYFSKLAIFKESR